MFTTALNEMGKSGLSFWGPRVFQDYCRLVKRPTTDTARYISIDSKCRLHPQLVEAQCMVFRLGTPSGGRHTNFGLVKCFTGWDDYFFNDDTLFSNLAPEVFVPNTSARHLFPFRLLPAFTETSLVNLALASGLMAHALCLDDEHLPLSVATGQSTFSFEFRPHSEAGVVWNHAQGQIEVDGLFVARRAGRETVFVIESKAGRHLGSLSKHKLFYPVLAIRKKVPREMPVVPVYLRVVRQADGFHFYFAECQMESSVAEPVLSALKPSRSSHFLLQLFH